jgi:hypothetical protein
MVQFMVSHNSWKQIQVQEDDNDAEIDSPTEWIEYHKINKLNKLI